MSKIQRRPKTFKGKVLKNYALSPRVNHIDIALDEKMEFSGGQFGWLAFTMNEELLRKPYSIASAPWENNLSLCVTKVIGGKVSPKIHELQKGHEVEFLSPLGVFTLPQEIKYKHILFIAAGSGVAPFRSMIRELFEYSYSKTSTDTNKEVTLLFGTRDSESILYKDEFENLPKEKFDFKVALSREKNEKYLQGYVQEHIRSIITQPEDFLVYVCGLSDMIREVKKELLAIGLTTRQIHVEIYT